jgi:hypothetical protein
VPIAGAHFPKMPDPSFCCKKSTGDDSFEASRLALFEFGKNFPCSKTLKLLKEFLT